MKNIFHILQSNLLQPKFVLLLSMGLLYFASYFQRVAVPGICFDELQRDFQTSAAAITALGSIFLYIYGFAQFFVGMAADRFGGRPTMLVGAGILTCASILFPFSHSLSMLYAMRALLAAGASTIFLSLVKEINTLFNPRHFAVWLGVALFMGYSGGLAGTLPFEHAIARFGWRNAMLGEGILCALALIFAAIVFHKFRSDHLPRANPTTTFLAGVLQNRLTYPVAVCSAVNFSIYFLFQAAIGKKMLTDCCGISSARAASIAFAMILFYMSGASTCGFIAHLFGGRRKPIILASVLSMLVITVLLTSIMRDHPDYRILAGGLLFLSIVASPSPIFLSVVKEVNAVPAAATAVGIANCAAYLMVAILTNLAGPAMDLFREQASLTTQAVIYPIVSYRLILSGCVVLAAVSTISAFFIRETKGNYLN